MSDSDMNRIMFSRSTMGGKKTAKVEARVSEDLKDRLTQKWRESGYTSESEFIERLLSLVVYGVEEVAARQQSMTNSILDPLKK